MGDQAMYREHADLYDRIYHWKDYAAESARLRGLLTVAGVPDGARVVEAACGTGSYLAHIAKHYDAAGFDLSPEMTAIAKAKVPAARVFTADLADFTLDDAGGAAADAIVCMFGSFGYLMPERRAAAAACFLRALRPGGVGVIEAWLRPEDVKPGHISVQTYDGETATPPEALKLVRAATLRVDGRRTSFDFHWLVVRPAGTEHFVDHHELWMATGDELLEVFRAAGFDATWIHPGPISGRGVLLLRRPQ